MKTFKIKAVVNPDQMVRQKIIRRILVENKFALSPMTAKDLIMPSIDDVDLHNAYFIAADNYNFNDSPATNLRLVQAAAMGMLVVVGCRKLPAQFDYITEQVYD